MPGGRARARPGIATPAQLDPFGELAKLPPGRYPGWRIDLSLVGLCEWPGRNWCRACKGVLTEPYEWESGLNLYRVCLVMLNPHLR